MDNKKIKIYVFDQEDVTATLIENYLHGVTFNFEILKFTLFDKNLIKDDGSINFVFIDIAKRNVALLKQIPDIVSNPNNIVMFMSSDVDTDLYVQAVRVGVKEFLKKPFVRADFLSVFSKYYNEALKIEVKKTSSKVISVTSFEKGSGKTFFAINIARELAGLTKQRVLLVDFNDNLNNVALSLDMDIAYDTKSFIKNTTSENAKNQFPKLYNYKNSSLYIVSNGVYKSDIRHLSHSDVVDFIKTAKRFFRYIVIDANISMDEIHDAVFGHTDCVFYTITASISSAERNKRYIESAFDKRPIKILLNKYRLKDETKINDIESFIGRDISFKIPMNLSVTMGSNAKGKTIREISPDSDIVKAYNKIAKYIISRV